MSRDGSVVLQWGDEETVFRLRLGEWRRIQERCDAGPGEIYRRLVTVAMAMEKGFTLAQAAAVGMIGDWRVDDMREVIVQGLIGGGRSELEARALVQRRVDEVVDFKAHLALAFAIVRAGLGDVTDEASGEAKGAGSRRKPRSRKASSASQ
ncbi:gene transfer agent family protein [uncultured Caulobacter sp.]|jgi:hypothetical protein|uniref:gene transfer agent family protein n=1 Tax=uncultured Caulobacter sp. TaxID=158749 RepID=UPI0026379B8A|nr:gene transfer agent family protein [uncultured Caulobacter sp.]